MTLAIVRGEPHFSHYLDSHGLNQNKEFMTEVAKIKGLNFYMASSLLLKDRDVVLAAVRTDGMNVQYISDELYIDSFST